MIKAITTALASDPEIARLQVDLPKIVEDGEMKLEELLHISQRSAGSSFLRVLKIFESTSPNIYHHFAARLLASRAVTHVITTNFDRLIELASLAAPDVMATEAECLPRTAPALYKIHGTIDRPASLIAVLDQVSRGLGPNKRELMMRTLRETCIVIGWSDNDIDLTPPFLEAESGCLIWFIYDPQDSRQVIDFGAERQTDAMPGLHPRVRQILERRRGIAVACDPEPFVREVWRDLQPSLGPIPKLDSQQSNSMIDHVREWSDSLTRRQRLLIVADILRRLAHWREASALLKGIEPLSAGSQNDFSAHYRLALCSTHLRDWRAAFEYFESCLLDKGLPSSIEKLLQNRPDDDPDLAVLYGNLARLLEEVGRIHESIVCDEMDVALCERFGLDGRALACTHLAAGLRFTGEFNRAKDVAEKAIRRGVEEGDINALHNAHMLLAHLAARVADWEEARSQFQCALNIADALGTPNLKGETLKNFGQFCCNFGNSSEGLHYIQEGSDLAEQYGLVELQAELWMVKGTVLKDVAVSRHSPESLSTSQEIQDSVQAYDKAIGFLPEELRESILGSAILSNRGLAAHYAGRLEDAIRDLGESLRIRTSLLDDIGRANILDNLALVLLNCGADEEAEAYLCEALEIYLRFGNRIGRCQVLHDLAGVYITRLRIAAAGGSGKRGRRRCRTKAESYLRESLSLATELRIPSKVKQAERNLRLLESLD